MDQCVAAEGRRKCLLYTMRNIYIKQASKRNIIFMVIECITVKTISALKETSMFAVFGGPPTHTATPKEPHPISTTLRSVLIGRIANLLCC